MSVTRFLDRDQYWQEIAARIPRAKRVLAAVAYFGSGGASFLPLRSGDQLVVDMSLGAAKQGVTDPKEIQKLLKRGVAVYTRRNLHAKLLAIDGCVIVSSANVSRNAREQLDEAAMFSTEATAVSAAKRYIRSMCSEPVREAHLKECLAVYRPPSFKAAKTVQQPPRNAQRAKLWFVGGLHYIKSEKDQDVIDWLERAAEAEMLNPEKCELHWIRFSSRPKWFSEIQRQDWVIDCVRAGKRRHEVGPPVQVIRKREYKSSNGKTYHMLMVESPVDGECMSLTEFQSRWRKIAPRKVVPKRTQPISDTGLADSLLRLWTRRGKIAATR
jgi:hypothetical protein